MFLPEVNPDLDRRGVKVLKFFDCFLILHFFSDTPFAFLTYTVET